MKRFGKVTIWYVNCPVCNGTIAALTRGQVLFRANKHIRSWHKANDVNVEELVKSKEVELT